MNLKDAIQKLAERQHLINKTPIGFSNSHTVKLLVCSKHGDVGAIVNSMRLNNISNEEALILNGSLNDLYIFAGVYDKETTREVFTEISKLSF